MDSGRLLLISGDSHVGPSLRGDLRPYCDREYVDDFDAYADEMDELKAQVLSDPGNIDGDLLRRRERGDLVKIAARLVAPNFSDTAKKNYSNVAAVAGLVDPDARIADMDAEGVAADVIFAGGQNGELLPFVGMGFSVGPDDLRPEHQVESGRIFNRWLADFVNAHPGRHIGCMQVPIFDIDTTIKDMHTFREKGLKAVNFPAPRASFPAYNDPVYEPFWSACEELDLPLCCHSAGGEEPLGSGGPGGIGVQFYEMFWLGRRAMWEMIFGGVFERHPALKLVLTEQGARWIPETLKELDSLYECQLGMVDRNVMPKPPSEYFERNCFVVASFPAPYEVALRHEVGMEKIIWGGDYPHYEGTWPRTEKALRHAFEGVPTLETAQIVGGNALKVYDLDPIQLGELAARIGPRVDEVGTPLEELPEHRGLAFRKYGMFA
jgi:predicted TIM-barrel fold metal-dependent hydrolase